MRSWRPVAYVALFALAAVYQKSESPKASEERFLTSRENPLQLALPPEDEAFSFALFGDRTGGPVDGVKILAQAVKDVNAIGPDLVMTVGDLVNGYNTTERWLVEMREFKGIMNELDCEWFPVAGNHDTYWRGEGKPEGEHDANYEEHFGPLWYAFRHKSAWFIILYSDEGNPETGVKDFNRPDCQRISAEQYAWLDETLVKTTEAEHVFVVLHHPRWKGGQYGDDWQRVHARLVEAGNVSAVFAGHIHAMTYDGVQDGIEYFTLATVGGFQDGTVPAAGYLHQFDLVTVRRDRIDIASIPVGEVTDPRTITSELARDAQRAHEGLRPRFSGRYQPFQTAEGPQAIVASIRNNSSRTLELTTSLESGGPHIGASRGHRHHVLAPRAVLELPMQLRPEDSAATSAEFRLPELVVSGDFLSEGLRLHLPEQRFTVPASALGLQAPPPPEREHVLFLNGDNESCLAIPNAALKLPGEQLTVEGWLYADEFRARQGFVNKTENSEFALFAGGGRASFLVHVGGRYVSVEAAAANLPLRKWTHLAGVFDGNELRLYVNGQLAASKPASGTRKRNELPLIIGGDVDREGRGVSLHHGRVDEIRLSPVARYTGQSFEPHRRFETDRDTALLLHMDSASGPWAFDASQNAAHAERRGFAEVLADG